jgi:5-methyltetrahydropteroyltriglutamate--homocysteine methyltransferase
MLAKVLTDRHYSSRAELAMAIAAVLRHQLEQVDADVVQLDEANISGHPEDADWAADAINHVLDGVAGVRAVHICFGNYGGQSVQQGFWKNLMPFFNRLHADHLVLEFARRGYSEIEHFRELKPETGLGLGVVDIKDNLVETPELVAERIEMAAQAIGEERIHYIHPDCGFWMLQRNVADRKMRALVEGRNLFEGKAE